MVLATASQSDLKDHAQRVSMCQKQHGTTGACSKPNKAKQGDYGASMGARGFGGLTQHMGQIG